MTTRPVVTMPNLTVAVDGMDGCGLAQRLSLPPQGVKLGGQLGQLLFLMPRRHRLTVREGVAASPSHQDAAKRAGP